MDKYGLVGNPLGHSFSKNYFNDKFAEERIDAEYINFEIPQIDDFQEVLDSNPELRGLNVTIPYKQKIIPFLDEVSKEALEIGAVNVVKVEKRINGSLKLTGFNSDYIGFLRSIEPLLQPHHKKALILGTGGASKAVYYALTKKLGMEAVFVSRYHRPDTAPYSAITPEVVKEYEVIVNCTPCGMFPHSEECPPLPYEAMTEKNLLYDLVYNPDETLFMKNGAKYGATVKNGLEMLLLQALASWEYWNGEE
jgi:shikimate dehydrogenase